ncbi:PREDICTED: E3 ubiquitin-protein ligase RAD18 [Condylura cristata]|uniref:E3 ubiquitin-protein ligase RAD18 n=1 Tax=Condylura cristata TaxID=143302 RepID=UPI00064397B2|nr:PREDICTED: E3 ubiquitin-protein ligase RAD18 [Condylura cristata]
MQMNECWDCLRHQAPAAGATGPQGHGLATGTGHATKAVDDAEPSRQAGCAGKCFTRTAGSGHSPTGTTLDDLLRCGICFEYFNIAMMIPQCSHNYCSLCIRKFLSYKTQCPTCRVTVTEPDLKNNRVLDELVKSLNFARSHLLQLAFESPPVSPPAAASSGGPAARAQAPAARRPSSKQGSSFMENFLIREPAGSTSALLSKENESKFRPQKETSASADTTGSPGLKQAAAPEAPSTSAMKPVARVDCPVCGVSIPENHINKHLDSCLSREEKKESLRSSVHKRKPLPKTVYNLLSDRDLKKKLKQHGLSVQGSKQQLIKRHQEFVHMYNAQCDALHPKSAAEIVQEIENMEKTRLRLEASKLKESVMVFTKAQTEKEIDEIHSKYRRQHQTEFQLLVDQAKKGYKKTAGMSKTRVIKEEEETPEKQVSVFMGPEDKMKFSGTPSVTSCCPQSKLDSPGKVGPERPDDSSSCTDVQEDALSSPESESCNSSSSDIIRDLLEGEEAWEAAHRNDLQDTATLAGLQDTATHAGLQDTATHAGLQDTVTHAGLQDTATHHAGSQTVASAREDRAGVTSAPGQESGVRRPPPFRSLSFLRSPAEATLALQCSASVQPARNVPRAAMLFQNVMALCCVRAGCSEEDLAWSCAQSLVAAPGDVGRHPGWEQLLTCKKAISHPVLPAGDPQAPPVKVKLGKKQTPSASRQKPSRFSAEAEWTLRRLGQSSKVHVGEGPRDRPRRPGCLAVR